MRVLHVGFGFRPWRWGGLIAYAEDLMDEQVARGHEVGYFYRGRQYPFMTGPRLKRWSRRGIRMYEIVNGGIPVGGDDGTRRPDLELDHPPTERAFARALEELRPEVVHVHELLGLPSSVFEVAKAHGVPVLMTLQDYQPLCPTIKLFDADAQICLRPKPGEMCRVCCRDASLDPKGMVDATTLYEQTRALEAVPGLKHVPRPRVAVRAIRGAGGAAQDHWRARRSARAPAAAAPSADTDPVPPAAAYDRRREVMAARLSDVHCVAMSHRVADIYTRLGVDPAAVRVLHLTLAHIASIRPRRMESVATPVRFATLAGCASRAKGVDVVLAALEALRAAGLGVADYTLEVRGYVPEPARTALEAAPEVVMGGLYGPDELDGLLAGWDVGIVPSAWEEAYGYVGLELLAGGVPVIGNGVGGIPDYCRDGETGWLNRSRDGAGLAGIMASIVADPEVVLARNARILELRDELVKPFPAHAAEIEALYAEVG